MNYISVQNTWLKNTWECHQQYFNAHWLLEPKIALVLREIQNNQQIHFSKYKSEGGLQSPHDPKTKINLETYARDVHGSCHNL